MQTDLNYYSLIIFIVALVGGILPLIRKWSDELLHLFISFGAGIFIGTVFLHLIPEALHVHGHVHAQELNHAPLFMLIGFMLIFFVEKIVLVQGDSSYDHGHRVISITALVGLSLHSIIAGFGLAVGSHFEGLGGKIFFSIIAHKATAAFALSSLFVLAKMKTRVKVALIVLFSLMTPAGVLIFGNVFKSMEIDNLSPLLGLTAGTFLYVAVGELLPEVFHTKEKKWLKLAVLIIGIIVMTFFGHGEH